MKEHRQQVINLKKIIIIITAKLNLYKNLTNKNRKRERELPVRHIQVERYKNAKDRDMYSRG